MSLTSSEYLQLVVQKIGWIKLETYLEINVIIYKSEKGIQVVDQVRMFIHKHMTKLQIMTLVSTYVLC